MLTALVLLSLLLTALPVRGEDIDLFLNRSGGSNSSANALFLLDNSANWNATLYRNADGAAVTKRHIIHEALYRVLTAPRYQNALRAGLMGFSHGNSPKGGKMLLAVDNLDATYQAKLADMLYTNGELVFGQEKLPGTNNAPDALMLHEAYLYLSSLAPRSGLQDGDHDPAALDGSSYLGPAQRFLDGCADNVVILIANGEPDSGENKDAGDVLEALGGRRTDDPISLAPDQFESNWADEMARFMAGRDLAGDQTGTQNIITYVIDIFDPAEIKTRKDKSARALLRSIAQQGRGRYFTAKNLEELIQAIEDILNELEAINSVFAAVNLPVSVNVRGTHLNQVYMGMFRPDAQNRPRWFGNLKLYQLGSDTGTGSLALVDANGAQARSAATGFIVSDAASHWTTDSSFWQYQPRGNPPSASDLPDGEVVEKGGAAQRAREDWPQRRLYTCTGDCTQGSELALTPFAADNGAITTTALGVADATERGRLIDWVRGADDLDENLDGYRSDVRPSLHGDVLHSRPAVINYNRGG
ncbi:MAG: hypothetical protein R3310_17750, partial [Candidatus Competibacteraceae bacterium]|nr:hypothetical protein [Candidatus Competibacteraceae bacterium]